VDPESEVTQPNEPMQELELMVFPDELETESVLNSLNLDPDQNYFKRDNWSSDYISTLTLGKKIRDEEFSGKQNFSLLHINCRSVLSKISEIKELAEKLQISILALSETWLDNDSADTVIIPGYNFVGRARVGGRGGGVGFLIKDNFNFQIYNPLKGKSDPKTFESLFIRVKLKKTAPIIGIIYRPPGQGLKDFIDEIEELSSCLKKNSTEIILLGDFNMDLLKVNEHKETNIFYNLLISNQYLPVITKPTRITPNTKTLIDNIFCTAWSKLQYASIIISDLSDHLPIYAQFALEATTKQEFF